MGWAKAAGPGARSCSMDSDLGHFERTLMHIDTHNVVRLRVPFSAHYSRHRNPAAANKAS